MKRIFLLSLSVLIVTCCAVFSGCSQKEISPQKADIDFNCPANIKCNGLEYRANISCGADEPLVIEITSPESLAGLMTGFKDNVFRTGIGKKICQTENHYLPDTCPSQQLCNFIEYLSAAPEITPYAEENGLLLCRGKIYSKEFDFALDKTSGKVVSYSSDDVKIEFILNDK